MLLFNFPIMLVAYILDLLSGYAIFSTLDMTNGFWQCGLHIESRKYTAFSTPRGHWQYTVCPQGIKNGPGWFSFCVSEALKGCRSFAINYFDDIVIFSKSVDEHFLHVKLVMEALKNSGFKISSEKCVWFATSIPLLGYIVSGKSVSINPDKIITIRNRPEPKSVKEVQQCLGLFNFYRRFINKFAEKSKPLYRLIQKNIKFEWTEECKQAYKYFIECLTSEPAMAQPILGKPFIVYSDGSKHAIGGVLAQKINGVEHIIEYASRLLKGAELNYGISDIECLAAVYLIKKWHHYLYGVHFTLFTDHKALVQLMNIKDYWGRLGRQAMFLQEYVFTIQYLPGEENSAADVTSRPPQLALLVTTRSKAKEKELDPDVSFKYDKIDIYEDLPLVHYIKTGKHLPGVAKHQVKRITRLIHKFIEDYIYSMRDNI